MKHPLYKLGKKKPRRDKRNLMLRDVLKPKANLPAEYSFDLAHPGVPLRMFGNDQYGDCVTAERAHQTMRFELLETGKVPAISDREVIQEYRRETGGADTGLVILDSLNEWRQQGWKAAGRNYKIKAFAEIDRTNRDQLRQTVFADVGACIGIMLPASAMLEFDAGKPWSNTKGRGVDGHCVLIVGYTIAGPVCVTWAQRQQMTWAWYAKYCDEAYAAIDAADTAKKRSMFGARIDHYLATLDRRGHRSELRKGNG